MDDLFGLFDPPAKEEKKQPKSYSLTASQCRVHDWEKTETFWESIQETRLTWTCRLCGSLRGRA